MGDLCFLFFILEKVGIIGAKPIRRSTAPSVILTSSRSPCAFPFFFFYSSTSMRRAPSTSVYTSPRSNRAPPHGIFWTIRSPINGSDPPLLFSPHLVSSPPPSFFLPWLPPVRPTSAATAPSHPTSPIPSLVASARLQPPPPSLPPPPPPHDPAISGHHCNAIVHPLPTLHQPPASIARMPPPTLPLGPVMTTTPLLLGTPNPDLRRSVTEVGEEGGEKSSWVRPPNHIG
jgi:hypothetical protein